MAETFDQPSTVGNKRGNVHVEGPDSVDVELTPVVAAETGVRLLDAAAAAHGDKLIGDEMKARRPSDDGSGSKDG